MIRKKYNLRLQGIMCLLGFNISPVLPLNESLNLLSGKLGNDACSLVRPTSNNNHVAHAHKCIIKFYRKTSIAATEVPNLLLSFCSD